MFARGGEVLAPGRPERYVQFIDVRDLAEWTVSMIESKATGVYNASGLPKSLTMEMVLEECKRVSDSDASFTWASDDFLLHEKVVPWSEMPLWFPEEAAPHLKGFMFINCDKAVRRWTYLSVAERHDKRDSNLARDRSSEGRIESRY